MAERGRSRSAPAALTRERLRKLKARDRERFLELWEDARTRLQRELLERAVLAGRTVTELHGFADAIRGLTDSVVYRLCYELDSELGPVSAFPQRLRAEADPMDGYLLNQRAEEATQPWLEAPRASALSLSAITVRASQAVPIFGGTLTRITGNVLLVPKPLPKRELGSSGDDAEASLGVRVSRARPAPTRSASVFAPIPTVTKALPAQIRRSRELSATEVTARTGTGARRMLFDDASVSRAPGSESEAALNEAFAGSGLRFRERMVDGPRFTLETALSRAGLALERGIPVPVILGSEVGELVAYAVLLQVSRIGNKRAFQLHDPFSRLTVWVAEKDLLARKQLPGMDRSRRRVTAVSLPV